MASIACLLGTYGRYDLVCESLACFLSQTAVGDATLLIYNQHPTPMTFEHPRVTVVNEAAPPMAQRYIRHRMVELSDPSIELVHFWDDDDLYLPWHIEDTLASVGSAAAWKPATSWTSYYNTAFERGANTFEGSWTMRRRFVIETPIDGHPAYTDHPAYREAQVERQLATTEFGDRTSYIYRWSNGAEHLSAHLSSGSLEQQRTAVAAFRAAPNKVRNGGKLEPTDLSLRWLQFVDGVRPRVASNDMRWLEARLFGAP